MSEAERLHMIFCRVRGFLRRMKFRRTEFYAQNQTKHSIEFT